MAQTLRNPAAHAFQRRSLSLTVLIPCYNEAATIAEVLARVEEVGLADEILIVDDGSTDGTRDVLAEIEAEGHPNLRILYHEQNQGKGAALVTGFQAARAMSF